MSRQQQEFSHLNHLNKTTNSKSFHFAQKPIEIYVFLDPFSKESWSINSYLKRMTMEYGRFFTMRLIVSGTFCLTQDKNEHTSSHQQISCISKNKLNPPTTSQPFMTYFAIKAAELQGKKAGNKFLETLQEKIFLKNIDISSEETLFKCALKSNLDMEEFERDFFSSSTKNAYQCDRRLTKEMDVTTMPTLVFFNQRAEGHGIKVSGLYSYDVYEMILSEILTYVPIPSAKLSLKEYIAKHSFVSSEEISIMYDWNKVEAEREMKKLQLKQKVTKYNTDYGTFWKATF